MIGLLPLYKNTYDRSPRRESERELLLRLAREQRIEERRARRRSTLRRLTGRQRRAR